MARFRFIAGPFNGKALLADDVLTANGESLLPYRYQDTCPDTLPLEDDLGEVVQVADEEVSDISVVVANTHSDSTHARRFVDLLEEGSTPAVAANRMGFRLRDLQLNGEFLDRVKARLVSGFIPDDIRRALVKASLNTVLLDSMNDPETYRMALDAAKLIAQDPDVGLNVPPQPSVVVNIGDLEGLLKKVDPDLDEGP